MALHKENPNRILLLNKIEQLKSHADMDLQYVQLQQEEITSQLLTQLIELKEVAKSNTNEIIVTFFINLSY